MTPAPSLAALIVRIESATGPARLAVPADAPTGIAQLISAPRAFEISIAGERLREHITPSLRQLAAMQDPVADAHAGWLIAVLLHAAGLAPDHNASLAPSTDTGLTPEGRAWLVQQAIGCAASEAQRLAIGMALRVASTVPA